VAGIEAKGGFTWPITAFIRLVAQSSPQWRDPHLGSIFRASDRRMRPEWTCRVPGATGEENRVVGEYRLSRQMPNAR
jgi:hypothetical protein